MVQYIDKLTEFCLALVHMDELYAIQMKDNAISRIKVESLEDKIKEFHGHSGFFYEYYLKDIMEIAPLCDKRVQTIAYIGDRMKFGMGIIMWSGSVTAGYC